MGTAIIVIATLFGILLGKSRKSSPTPITTNLAISQLPKNPTTRDWIQIISALAPDLVIDKYGLAFALAWIEWESGGNPCAWGNPQVGGRVQEAGIAQTNFAVQNPDSNLAHGITSNEHRMEKEGVCSLYSNKPLRQMTKDEALKHATEALDEIREGISVAKRFVPTWTGPELYAVAKTWHGFPHLPDAIGVAIKNGATNFSQAADAVIKNKLFAGGVYNTKLLSILNGAKLVGYGLDRLGHPIIPPPNPNV